MKILTQPITALAEVVNHEIDVVQATLDDKAAAAEAKLGPHTKAGDSQYVEVSTLSLSLSRSETLQDQKVRERSPQKMGKCRSDH